MIQDNTRCIGCRACMVACKSWNDRPADHTDFFAGAGYQNPRDLDANNYTLITFNEITTGARPNWVFGRQLCMHCDHPACASACPTTALKKTAARPRGVRRVALHRVPGLHAGVPIPDSQVRLREPRAADPQVHVLRRPPRGRPEAGVRDRLPHRRHQLRRPRRHGGRGEAADRDGAGHVHPGDLRPRRGRRDQRAASVVRAVRADRLHHRACRRRRCRTSPTDGCASRPPVFGLLYGVFARADLDRALAQRAAGSTIGEKA